MKKQLLLNGLFFASLCWEYIHAQNCSTPSFNEVKNISVCRPSSITKSDFNGDGNLDIAFTSDCDTTPSNVTVLFGNSAGSFVFHSKNIVNSGSRFVTTGDFNNDGKADLVTSNYKTNTVSVLQGDGTGNFGPASYFPVGRSPWGVAVGDFNRDGKPDLAVANSYFDSTSRDTSLWVYSKFISILLGDGNCGFGAADSIEVGNAPMWVVTDDFNGDGKSDLAVANLFSFNVCILFGNGRGSFSPPTFFPVEPGGGSTCVATADFDGDKKPDLVVSNFYQDNISILLNNGHGSFIRANNYAVGMGVFPIAIEDLNKDGKLDLVVVNLSSDNVSILLGNGFGGFSPPVSYKNSAHATSIAIGDYNGDRKPDFAISNLGLNNISIFWGDGLGAFFAPRSFPVASSPLFISKSDFNDDGKSDLVTVNGKTNNISILEGDGHGGFGTARNFSVGDSAQAVAIGDFNGDGDKDLAVANYKSNNVSVLLGDGSCQFTLLTNITVGTGPGGIATSDFNRDGKLDLAVTNSLSNNVSILLGNGNGTFNLFTSIAMGSNPRSIAIGDFNADGKEDLATANYGSNNITILLGTGTGAFSLLNTIMVGSNPGFIVTSDFERNGKLDLAVANWGSNSVSVLMGNGDGSFNVNAPVASGLNPRFVDISDFNGDNNPDLAVANWGSNTNPANPPCVSILIGNGNGGFVLTKKIATTRQTSSVAIGDFDKDGLVDLATGGYFSLRSILQPQLKVGFVSVFLNIEKPRFFVKSATPEVLFPPNHKLIEVTLNYWALDNCPASLNYHLVSVTSNEPDNGLGDGDQPGDIVIVDDHHLKLRAERSALGDGRIYTVTVLVTDGSGKSDITIIPIVVR